MKAQGIDANVMEDWFNRKQQALLNGEASDFVGVTSGVPQGSVLGLLLFLINLMT